MRQNVGRMDRRARIATGAALVGAGIVSRGPVRSAAALGVGGTMLATGATGYCPAYELVDVDTRGNGDGPDDTAGRETAPDADHHGEAGVTLPVESDTDAD